MTSELLTEMPEAEDGWTTALRCQARLRRRFAVSYASRFGPGICDELWSDVVLERCTRVFETFDPDKVKGYRRDRSIIVNLDGYFIGIMCWYAWKWMRSRMNGLGGKRTASYGKELEVYSLDCGKDSEGEHHWEASGAHGEDVANEVSTLTTRTLTANGTCTVADLRDILGRGVEGLDEFECWLIHQVVIWGRTYPDIAKTVDATKRTVGRWYRAAIDKVRNSTVEHLLCEEIKKTSENF